MVSIASDTEERKIITNVSWAEYLTYIDKRDQKSSPERVSYFKGILEIVAPSRRHEMEKSRIGDLLLIYFLETNTQYFPVGSATLRNIQEQIAAEPDESYCIGAEKSFPDLVIEVVVTSGNINRLEIYQKLGVKEVWFWQNQRLLIYFQTDNPLDQSAETFGYSIIERSEILPYLDIPLLVRCLNNPNPLAAAKEFRQSLIGA